MAEAFDPYHKWLGISPKDQPPHHYRLLALELFESDLDVIESAADQRMAHVRTFQTGKNSALSQYILNELSQAKLCLLIPQKKAEYDRQLREKQQQASAPLTSPGTVAAAAPAAAPRSAPMALPLQPLAPVGAPIASSSSATLLKSAAPRKQPVWRQPAVLGAISLAAASAFLAAVVFFVSRGNDRVAEGAKPASQPATASPSRTTRPRAPQENTVPAPVKVAPIVEPTIGALTPAKPDFEILDASWGAGDKRVDVTGAVREQVKDHRLVMMAWQNLVGCPKVPAEGANKTLRLRYRARGRTYYFEYREFSFIYLDGNPLAPPTDSPDGWELLEARYGAGTTYLDVLADARARVRDGRFSAAADDFYRREIVPEGWTADDWAAKYKVLWLRYRNATGEHFAYAWNEQRLLIDGRSPQAAGPSIDLLRLIDVKRDAVQGDWKFEGDKLVAPGGMYDRLQLPVDAPDEYALTVVVEAEGELRDVNAGLALGNSQVICCIDGGLGRTTGLNLVHGAWFSQPEKNPTSSWRMTRLLEQGRPNTLTYIVRKTSLQAFRDGAELVRWSGDPRTLSLPGRGLSTAPRRVFVQSYDMPFRISKLQLTPLAPAKTEMFARLEPGQPVDALKAVDLDRDQIHGRWQWDGPSLVSSADERCKVQIPFVLPDEYRLEVVAARLAGDDHFSLTLPLGGAQTSVILDAYGGTLSGLQTIDGKKFKFPGDNETRYEGSVFSDDKPKSLAVTVRKNRIQVECDGRTIVDWTGDVSRLGPNEPLPYKDRVYVGSWYSSYKISKVEVTPLASSFSPPLAIGEPVDLLKQIDPKRDAISGDWQLADGVLISPDAPFSKLLLPAPPAPDYQLTIVAQKVRGNYGLGMAIVLGGRQVVAHVDGVDGTYAGLTLLDGKDASQNETGRRKRLLVDGQTSTFVYTVRRNQIHVALDGRTVVDWQGDPNRLSTTEGSSLPEPTRLALCEFKTVMRISKIDLTPIVPSSGSSTVEQPGDAPEQTAPAPNAVPAK